MNVENRQQQDSGHHRRLAGDATRVSTPVALAASLSIHVLVLAFVPSLPSAEPPTVEVVESQTAAPATDTPVETVPSKGMTSEQPQGAETVASAGGQQLLTPAPPMAAEAQRPIEGGAPKQNDSEDDSIADSENEVEARAPFAVAVKKPDARRPIAQHPKPHVRRTALLNLASTHDHTGSTAQPQTTGVRAATGRVLPPSGDVAKTLVALAAPAGTGTPSADDVEARRRADRIAFAASLQDNLNWVVAEGSATDEALVRLTIRPAATGGSYAIDCSPASSGATVAATSACAATLGMDHPPPLPASLSSAPFTQVVHFHRN